jgi:septal ring factor EnvC (AmiA/AmiB activator)
MLTSIHQIPVIIAVVLILFSGSQPLPGGQIDEKQNELKRIEKKLELERKSLGKFQARERSILREMDGIEKRYQAVEKEIARLDGLGISLKGQIEEPTAEVARVEREISQKQDSLRQILVSAYKIGPLGGAKFLWAADSLRELDRGFYLIRRLSGEAEKIIDQYAGLQREGRRKKQQLQEQLNQVSLTEQKVREEKLEADKERDAKARLIQEVRNREEVRQQLISELEGAAKISPGKRASFASPPPVWW